MTFFRPETDHFGLITLNIGKSAFKHPAMAVVALKMAFLPHRRQFWLFLGRATKNSHFFGTCPPPVEGFLCGKMWFHKPQNVIQMLDGQGALWKAPIESIGSILGLFSFMFVLLGAGTENLWGLYFCCTRNSGGSFPCSFSTTGLEKVFGTKNHQRNQA